MSYQVTIASSGHTFDVEPLETVLDAALRQGIILPYGCRNGNCGNCKGDILSGSVDYEDGLPPALNDEDAAQNRALFCQAHPNCDLTIKVREVDAARDIEVRTLPCRVNKLEHLAHDVIRIYLKIPESQRLQFLAGQYIDVLLKDHAPRAFSIANAPHDDDYVELHVRHVLGGARRVGLHHGTNTEPGEVTVALGQGLPSPAVIPGVVIVLAAMFVIQFSGK